MPIYISDVPDTPNLIISWPKKTWTHLFYSTQGFLKIVHYLWRQKQESRQETRRGKLHSGPQKIWLLMFSAYWMLCAMVDNSTAVQRVLFYFPCTPLSPLISPSFTMKSAQYQLYTRDLKNPLFQPLGLKRSTRTFRFADFGLKYNKMLSKMVDCLLRKSCTWKNRIPRQ